MNYKSCLITCYFGEFPWYFNLFIKSCIKNPDFKFLIFTDQRIDIQQSNIDIINYSLTDFNIRAQEKLNISINIKEAYKLCDFKPAYGLIFSDYLNHFDWWGVTDIDLIFGSINKFIDHDLLNSYDFISVRNDYPTGSFMLFRNNSYMNTLFKQSKDWKYVFTNSKHFCFDECNFRHNYLQVGGDIFQANCEIESLHHVIKKNEMASKIRAHFDLFIIEGQPGELIWKNGILSYKKEFEVLLYHFIKYKSNKLSRKKHFNSKTSEIFIDKYSIRYGESLWDKWIYLYYNHLMPSLEKLIFTIDYNFSLLLKKSIEVKTYQGLKFSNQSPYLLDINLIFSSLFFRNQFYHKSTYKSRFKFNSKNQSLEESTIDGTSNLWSS